MIHRESLMRTEWEHLVDQLLAEALESFQAGPRGRSIESQIRTVLFADLCGSTEFWRTHGEREGYRRIQFHNHVCRRVVESFHGVVVKELGDGVLATFDSAEAAITAGLGLIRLWSRFNEKVALNDPIITKVAVTHGRLFPVTSAPGDFIGESIVKCLRLTEQSQPNHLVIDEAALQEWERKKEKLTEISIEPRAVSLPGFGTITIYNVTEPRGKKIAEER